MTEAVKQGTFSINAVRDALGAVRKNRQGALLITSGHLDVRLVIEPGTAAVEVAGFEVEGESEDDLVRAFLCCQFWEEPSFFLNLEGAPKQGVPAIRVSINSIYGVMDKIEQGLTELEELREAFPGLDVTVSVSGDPPPAGIEDDDDPEVSLPMVQLFRAVSRHANGAHLGSVAEQAGLDSIDVAWGLKDLLEEGVATFKRPPPTIAMRRLKHAEPLARDGILPGVRYTHLARGFTRSDPKRAARFMRDAANSFHTSGMDALALETYAKSLQMAPNSVPALEGQVRVLESLKRHNEARKVRGKLIRLYQNWAMPGRTLSHLEKIPDPDAEQEELQLNCMLMMRDFAGAGDFAKSLLPKMDADGRMALVNRFVECGAKGAELDRVVDLAGLHTFKGLKKVLLLLVLLSLVACVGVVGEVGLRLTRFKPAIDKTKADLAAGKLDGIEDHWSELAGWQKQAASRGVPLPFSCLNEVPKILEELKALQADQKLLADVGNRRAFAWANRTYWPKDVRPAEKWLEELSGAVQTDALKEPIKRTRGEIIAYLKEVSDKVEKRKLLNDLRSQFETGRKLLEEHANARHLFRNEVVKFLLKVSPTDEELKVYWNRAQQEPQRPGEWVLRQPLVPGITGNLRVELRNFIPREQQLGLEDDLEIQFKLVNRVEQTGTKAKLPRGVTRRHGLQVLRGPLSGKGQFQVKGANPTFAKNDAVFTFLKEHLRVGERGVIEVLYHARKGLGGRRPRVYLEGLRVWVQRGSGRRWKNVIPPVKLSLARVALFNLVGELPWVGEQISSIDACKKPANLKLMLEALETVVGQ